MKNVINGKEAGLILVHGFTGTPNEMEYVAKEIYRRKGWEISIPCLPGHCTTPEDLTGITANEYLVKITDEYKRLRKKFNRVFVAGLSMGGVLTLKFASKFRSVDAIVVMAAPMYLNGIHNRIALNLLNTANIRTSLKYVKKGGRDIHFPPLNYEFNDYSWAPMVSVMELQKLIKSVRCNLGLVTAPIQIFHSKNDSTAPVESAKIIFNNVSSTVKELMLFEDSYHVLTLDVDRECMIRKIINFLERFI